MSVPSLPTVARTSITPAGRKYAHANSSSRVQTSFTGFFAARAMRAASTAASPVCLPPYADPVSGTITRMRSAGTWNASTSSCCTPNGRCVPVHTVSCPSCHSATAARGSSGAWAM